MVAEVFSIHHQFLKRQGVRDPLGIEVFCKVNNKISSDHIYLHKSKYFFQYRGLKFPHVSQLMYPMTQVM